MGRRLTSLRVVRTEWLSPRMIRVVAGGADLADFPDTDYTDRHIKIIFPRPGVAYPDPLDLDLVRRTFSRSQWPRTRTYTVRAIDRAAGTMTIDFVHHGDSGLAGPWAATARPGDRLRLLGPGGAYAPRADADWHLLVGDEAALPAIAAALERIPAGVPVSAILQVDGPQEHQDLSSPGDARITWLHRPERLPDAVAALPFRPGDVHAFVHGEAGAVKQLRRHLLAERGIPRDALSISGYWRLGRDEDGLCQDKPVERAAPEPMTAG
ncbi:siderophore-interacting protein [Pseudonocardia asaccharolytica]|uniref:Siderophore-interacting protein n=1 Tax=Pseudonocardia asaccharolytica DSM 44247 = NBRC 16224 TaxID=1123024 RepID=A0A511CY07_9PSEU|nr:siderophore-interacting protein [Pseudonocardia asaccharolytica]GEL17449.1 siderophore-interacting protein [Pseudonocardia asaccharolytica DSM 44247 = NBRC 16224]